MRNGHQLGKPVRRENPNKPREDSQTVPEKEEPKTTAPAKTDARQSGNWADALKRAMDAIN